MIEQVEKHKGSSMLAEGAIQDSDIQAIKKDLMMLYRAVLALEKQVLETAVNTSDVRPQLLALKVHTDSIPHALREARRVNTAAIADCEARLSALEAKVNATTAAS
jgi:hypothetical protein